MSCTPKPTPLPRWPKAPTTATARRLSLIHIYAIITKGIIALLIRVLGGRTPQEILDTDLYFIDAIGLSANLSPTRSNGLLAMVKQMRLYALAFSKK